MTALIIHGAYRPFARALRDAMTRKQMSASDVARLIWGTTTDHRGYTVAKNRNRIGEYLAGVGYPSAKTKPKLKAVLDLPDDVLNLSRLDETPVPGASDISFTLDASEEGMCSIKFNREFRLKTDTAMQIVGLLSKES